MVQAGTDDAGNAVQVLRAQGAGGACHQPAGDPGQERSGADQVTASVWLPRCARMLRC